jgi:predicted small metal-binding protein
MDCREMPSESNCTLTITGEEEEVVRTAAQHAVEVHGHTDDEDLRRGLRQQLRDPVEVTTNDGAFVQIIEFRTRRITEVESAMERWADAIGARRTARWGILTADRESPGAYIEVVEFPNYDQAMANSNDPITTEFAEELGKLSEGTPVFRNLDVRRVFA